MRRSLPAVAALAAGTLTIALGSSAVAAPVAPDPSPLGTPAGATVHAAGQIDVYRLAGSDRYDTAARTYTSFFSNAEDIQRNAVLASGENFPDALTAGSAGVVSTHHLLLTKAGSLPAVTRDALKAHPPVNLVIAGGESSVSSAVEKQVRALLPKTKVTRIAGANRYDTAVQLAYALQIRAEGQTRYSSHAWVVSGAGFADALAVGRASKWDDVPPYNEEAGEYLGPGPSWGRSLLLLSRRDALPAESLKALTDPAAGDGKGYQTVTIVGGPASVSGAVEEQIKKALPNAKITRIAGANRYDTARQVVTKTFGNAQVFGIAFASGENFPDALVANTIPSPDFPLLLMRKACTPRPTREAIPQVNLPDYASFTIFGGTNSVAEPLKAPVCP